MRREAWWFASVATCALAAFLARNTWDDLRRAVFFGRNFYGALRVEQLPDAADHRVKELMHGSITHGIQYLDRRRRSRPTTYYTPESGVGLAWRVLQRRGAALRVGVIGLGAGTLDAYGRAGDVIRFYEINPLVIDIARRQFSFLSDTPAHVEVAPGDARLVLASEKPQNFDLLVVDAFTGDAIPVHLLTHEAFTLYGRHLSPHGVVAFHVSNMYLDLPPLVAANARNVGWPAFEVDNDDNDMQEVYSFNYVLISRDSTVFDDPLFRAKLNRLRGTDVRLWTDDFNNFWQILVFQKADREIY